MKNYLCLDFGTKRIGVARSILSHAEPLEVIANNERIFERIAKLCADYQIDKIVLGLSEREMAQETTIFAEKLQKHLNLPIEFMDETMSSREVTAKLHESKAKMKTRRGKIDHFAAAQILEQFLDEHAE